MPRWALALESVLVVAMSLVALLTVGPLLQARLGLLGVLVAEAALVFLPAWLWAAHRGVSLAASRPRALAVAGGVLAGLGACWLMALVEENVLERLLPTPHDVRAQLEHLIKPATGLRPWLADLLALAIAPAVAEETMFRGAVLAAFSPLVTKRRWPGIVVAALLFAGFHASPYRFVAPALLGVALGAVRVASSSLWPAIGFHVANNVAVIALVRAGKEHPMDPRTPVGAALAVAAVAALLAGFALARPRTRT